jgi:aminoglycoside phosphotransferase (APT) family kinase protein
MHADEVEIDAPLVRRLVETQFPGWAGLPLRRVASAGTDNAVYRLGDALAVRLPRMAGAAGQVAKDARWLHRLAPALPLAVPELVGVGVPGEGFEWDWGVYRWLDGAEARLDRMTDPVAEATRLAEFVDALHRVDTSWGPAPARRGRGVPLETRDEAVRSAIESAADLVDVAAVTSAWEESLSARVWSGARVWVHGDLSPGNVLVRRGRVSAVIDFACLGVGDPACDLLVAWNLFEGESRERFREALAVDEATWSRGRGWALSVALLQLPYYVSTNPPLAGNASHVIAQILEDRARRQGPADGKPVRSCRPGG